MSKRGSVIMEGTGGAFLFLVLSPADLIGQNADGNMEVFVANVGVL